MAPRVLVINDSQEILDLFREILTDEGFDVVLYSYAIQDMREILRIQPDLIILDYIFGSEKSGWQTLQKLKMSRKTAAIPIIICTAAIKEVREIEGFLEAKGVTLVPKPFDIDDLLVAVRHALRATAHAATLLTNRQAQEEAREAEVNQDETGLGRADGTSDEAKDADTKR